MSQKQRSKSIRRSIVGAVAATAVAFGATALLPSAADAQVIQYNGTLTAGTINVRVGDATNARSFSSPDLAGTMASSFDDVANTFSGTATFTPYTAPNQDVGFTLAYVHDTDAPMLVPMVSRRSRQGNPRRVR